MSSNTKDPKGNGSSLLNTDPAKSKTITKGQDLEQIRQSLAKRSLNVKFDLEGSSYKPIENIGAGAYGVVCSAIHKKSGDRVAIKKTTHVFEVLTVAKRTYREIKILKHFKHDNIISIREILLPKEDVKSFKDIYIVFDLMESDLHHIIYSRQSLSEEHVRYFLYQILRGLKYIHSANVVHRDLKPSNLLVNEDCHLRIGDFGMARGIFYTPDEPSYYMTQYVATRWYRAPEILLSMLEYGTAVDMWSVGCIFAEMMGRKHLFPGKDYMSQVKLILGVLGTPPDDLMKSSQNDILKRIIKSFVKKAPEPWEKLFPNASKKSLDLLSKMLVLNPADRITVDRALSHRLLNHYHDPDDEPICVPAFNFDFEKKEMDMPCLRSVIMKEIMSFHRPKPKSLNFSAFLRPAPKEENKIAIKQDEDGVKLSDKTTTDTEGLGQIVDTQIQDNKLQEKPEVVDLTEEEKSSTSKKSSPVSILTSKSQLALPCIDIEMLSAQSQDGMEVQTVVEDVGQLAKEVVGEKPATETKAGPEVKKGGNTISEDTKALVKQALLNATQRRQRAESHGEDTDKSKPITAAQRQKEREEKRRKKKERAKEKVKKSKDKKGASEQTVSLSSEDVQLLKRWMGMQAPQDCVLQNPSPPHPGPPASHETGADATGAQSALRQYFIKGSSKHRHILAKTFASSISVHKAIQVSSSQMSTGTQMLISSSQINSVPNTFIPVFAVPSTTNPGKLEIKRIIHANQQQPGLLISEASTRTISASGRSGSNSSLASDSTKSLLQNAILLRNSNSSNASNFNPALQSRQPIGITKDSESKPSFVLQSGNENSVQAPEMNHHPGSNQSHERTPEQNSCKSDVLLSFPLKETQDSAVVNPNSKKGTALNDIPDAQQSPDILDFLNLKTPNDSPPCFDNATFPSPDLTTPNSGNDLNAFASLNFSPSPPYPFHQSPEQAQGTGTGNNMQAQGTGTGNNMATCSKSVMAKAQTPPQNPSQSDPTGQMRFPDTNVYQTGLSNTNDDSIANVPFQNFPSCNVHSQNLLSLSQSVHGIQNPPPTTTSVFPPSHMAHEDMVYTEGHGNTLSPFDPRGESSSSSSSSPFQPNVFQPQGHDLGVTDHQPMIFQQSNLPQAPQGQGQTFGSHPSQSFSSSAAKTTTESALIQSVSSTSSVFADIPQNFTFPQAPSSHMDFFSQHQQQQHQQQQEFSHNSHMQQVHHHQQQQHPQSHPFAQHQQQQQQQQQDQHNIFSQDPQPYPQQKQQQQQQAQHFTQPNHYQHHQQQRQQQQQQQPQPHSFLPAGMYDSSSNPHDSRTLMNTDSDLSVPFSIASASNLPFSSQSVSAEASTSYQGMAFGKNYSSSSSGKAHQLTVDTRKDKRMMLDSNQDLIAMISKQLSKSQVVDNFPPALALTPKGTGAGYGLGMDLDSILTDAQDNPTSRYSFTPESSEVSGAKNDLSCGYDYGPGQSFQPGVEQSPLSSSLLADWLDISNNINISQADLEALERDLALHSPMHVNYNDVNL